MGTTHIFLSPKDNIGKTFAASSLAQHYKTRGKRLFCFDTDPYTSNLSRFRGLHVRRIDPTNEDPSGDMSINHLFNSMLSATGRTQIVVDSSATTFLPFCSYLKEKDFLMEIVSAGHEVLIHTVLVGNASMLETLNGLNAIFQNFPNIPVVVWLNHHYGEIRLDGDRFEDTRFYRDNIDRIHGIISYGSSKADTFAHDIQMMLKDGLTFEEGIEGPHYFVHSRQRLAMSWRELDSKMELLNL